MTYNQLWKRLTAIYNEREAQAIVRTVLDALFGMSLTDICLGKVTQLSADDTTRLEKIMQRLQKSEPVQYVSPDDCLTWLQACSFQDPKPKIW